MRVWILLLALAGLAIGHAPIAPVVRGPLTVQGSRLVDRTGESVVLRGVNLAAGLAGEPMVTMGVLRRRWNLNAVRVAAPELVEAALANELAVVLAAGGDWRRWAGNGRVILEASSEAVLREMRGAGVTGAVIVAAGSEGGDGQVIVGGRAESGDVLGAFRVALGRRPVMATEWMDGGEPLLGLLTLENEGVSWMAAGRLFADFAEFEPLGQGLAVIQLTTGDLTGFGYLRAEAIASAAGGPAAPLAPGMLASVFVEQLGPERAALGALDGQGRLPVELGGTRVLLDGVAVPLLYADAYQINFQVPYGLRPGTAVEMQVLFGRVPSNRLAVAVSAATPELFQDVVTRYVVAVNQDGTRNGAGSPAGPGSIVVLYGTGGGVPVGERVTGTAASAVHPVLAAESRVEVDGRLGTVLFAGEVPGFVGLVQLNVRVPEGVSGTARAVPVVWRCGSETSRNPARLWVR